VDPSPGHPTRRPVPERVRRPLYGNADASSPSTIAKDNLFESLTSEARRAFEDGDGCELHADKPGEGNLYSTHSSSAAALTSSREPTTPELALHPRHPPHPAARQLAEGSAITDPSVALPLDPLARRVEGQREHGAATSADAAGR
jgi:hypothetical protein